jgi:hypothetical protein
MAAEQTSVAILTAITIGEAIKIVTCGLKGRMRVAHSAQVFGSHRPTASTGRVAIPVDLAGMSEMAT